MYPPHEEHPAPEGEDLPDSWAAFQLWAFYLVLRLTLYG